MARLRGQTGILDPTNSASMSVGETAPTSPAIGQRWFRLSSGVTYQYTNDGSSSFWLDVSSGGIGTSTYKNVDYIGDTDPHPRSNIAGAVAGSIYYNREGHRYFELTDATNNANVWQGAYKVVGGEVTTYVASNVTYRIHTFWGDGRLYIDSAVAADVLMVGGGGGGGGEFGGGGGGGGVLYVTGRTIPAGNYDIKVGAGGRKGLQGSQANYQALMGDSTIAFGATVYGGGPGQSRQQAWSNYVRTNMANGGGATDDNNEAQAGTSTSSSGFVGSGGSFTLHTGRTGGTGGGGGGNHPAGGGAGAGASGQSPGSTSSDAGNGGAGIQVGSSIYDNNNNFYWAGGGGGGAHDGTAGAGDGGAGGGGGASKYANGHAGTGNDNGISPGGDGGVANGKPGGEGGMGTGGGGGGSTHQYGIGGNGGSGIVIVKYAIN